MAFCNNCGGKLNGDEKYCPYCGSSLLENNNNNNNVNINMNTQQTPTSESGSAGWWGVLGFFIPIVGLVLYLVWKDEKPKASKAAGTGALIGAITLIVLVILYVVFIFSIIGTAFSYY